jgi:hypothetical protein
MPACPSSAARSRPQPPVLGHVGGMATAVARFKPAYSGPFQTRRVGVTGFEPATFSSRCSVLTLFALARTHRDDAEGVGSGVVAVLRRSPA